MEKGGLYVVVRHLCSPVRQYFPGIASIGREISCQILSYSLKCYDSFFIFFKSQKIIYITIKVVWSTSCATKQTTKP